MSQIDFSEVRQWAGLALSYVAAFGTGAAFLNRVFTRRINVVAETLRTAWAHDLGKANAASKVTAGSCIAHGVRIHELHEQLVVLRQEVNNERALAADKFGRLQAEMNILLDKRRA